MFYLKLAINNIKQSFKHFSPFFLVSVTTFVFNNITLLIMTSPTATSMGTGAYALGLAYFVLCILSAILCLYSYNFLLKQRNQEFGLYNILGMNKGQITTVSTIELIFIYGVTVVIGSILSAILSNLAYLIFANIIHYDNLNFSLNPIAFGGNIILFGAIFFLLELVNIVKIRKTSALNLFSNQSQGEREPRGNMILALISVAAIGYGYYLSVSSANLSALVGIQRFFIAILAVIVGTYLFYISFLTWYLKRRRKNKAYFYKPEHFITTSQMIFRMKQNAVGLANITLLAIMAFVTIFSTVALYSSQENLARMTYPKSAMFEFPNVSDPEKAENLIKKKVLPALGKDGEAFNQVFKHYKYTSFIGQYAADKKTMIVDESFLKSNPQSNLSKLSSISAMVFITQDDFRNLGNKLPNLTKDQIAFYDYAQNKSLSFDTLNWMGKTYQNVQNINHVSNLQIANVGIPGGIVVVADDETLNEMLKSYNPNVRYPVSYTYLAFADLSNKQVKAIRKLSQPDSSTIVVDSNETAAIFSTVQAFREEGLQLTGGFLFTGFLLSSAFLMGAALIIYYKQLSEGNQDKRSYKILQEVGMSLKAVKKTINSQIVMVFFMPLAISIVHFAFALPILKKLLLLFGVQGDKMLYTISGLTILGILVIYFIIYKVTSRTYYKLVER
ncbi:FtsX-like permease family protein [Streptococcus orisratti]|uniref:ABC transporter permease n=1 Tax=Streptococcus orisratti TaxID=114652 RepID=UPI0003776177|nr:ABC transporter permease [Streptococcus orisratti]